MAPRSAALLLLLPLALPAQPPARPRGDGAALAGRPVLTAAELDALEFSDAFDSPESRDRAPRESVDRLALGVWVSRRQYREGEPVPVLLAVRNTGPARGLDLRIELNTSEAAEYNGARLHLECTDAGTPWKQRLSRTYVCGGPPLATIERGGYYCAGGDLRALGGGRLPPGAYRLSWGYRGLKSNTVHFTVLPARDGKAVAPLSRRPPAGTLALGEGKLEGLPDGAREHSLRLTGARAAWSGPYEIAPHLAAGVAGKYYPSLADLPVLDDGLEVTARLIRRVPGALPAAVEITLRAAHPYKDLVIHPGDLHFALLVEPWPGNPAAVRPHAAGKAGDFKDTAKRHESLVLDRPLTLRLDLPEGWERHAPLTGPARVAVLVSTERLRRRDLRGAKEVRVPARAGGPRRQAWRGVLRSPWLEIELPPGPAAHDGTRRNADSADSRGSAVD
jgi:hypothetical protein